MIREIEHNDKKYRVNVECVCPPIPTRKFDYSAVDDDTYDGAPDSHCPHGTGETADEAIADLFEQIDEREN